MEPALNSVLNPAEDIDIRFATKADAPIILGFIRELAEYEKLTHAVVVDEQSLEHHLFGPHPYAECLLAEVEGIPAGFALFFHNFSTFLGKRGLYLEDLYIQPAYRSSGIGMRLLRELAKIAIDRDCGRMEWSVLDWNEPAVKFYRKLGAQPLSGWTGQRLLVPEIKKLAEG